MGKADEERLAIGVQKYPRLYDKVVSAFHNKNQKKNAWEAVAKDIGLQTGESFSPKIFCLCLHSPLCQALLIKLEHIFPSSSTRVPPLGVSVLILAPL